MKDGRKIVVGIGELLWDVLPGGKQLGGAPCNFAYHAHQAGCEAYVISAVGNDADGREIIGELNSLSLSADYVQHIKYFQTGCVTVHLDDNGIPDYKIHKNVAWDNIAWEANLKKLATMADAVCFGSLAQRTEVSRESIWNFVAATRKDCLRVFDINLRQNFYNKKIILKSLEYANILKLNEEELPIVADFMNCRGEPDQILNKLINDFQLKLIAYTQGSKGSLLITADDVSYCQVPKITVTDTVGAGDTFTGILIAGLLQQADLRSIHCKATEIAAFVCSQKGATPAVPLKMLEFN